MSSELPLAGIDCIIVPRKQIMKQPISASTVRQLIKNGDFEALKQFVPISTLNYFKSEEAAPIIERICQTKSVIHY
jgi:[citrate (pro-3S)-lyase] ligase